jgi:hypothetical protein
VVEEFRPSQWVRRGVTTVLVDPLLHESSICRAQERLAEKYFLRSFVWEINDTSRVSELKVRGWELLT